MACVCVCVCVWCCHVVVIDLMVKLICGLGEKEKEKKVGNNWKTSSVVSFNNCQMWLQVEHMYVCIYVCVWVRSVAVCVSNFDWKTCLTSCDFFAASAGQCDWHQLSGISDTTSRQSVSQSVSPSVSQLSNASVSRSTSQSINEPCSWQAGSMFGSCLWRLGSRFWHTFPLRGQGVGGV